MLLLLYLPTLAGQGTLREEKEKELQELESIVIQAKQRIRGSSNLRAADFLKLLPDITISNRSPVEDFNGNDIYIGASFSTGNIFSIARDAGDRKAAKKKALRAVQSASFRIRKLINKKYLKKERIWKYTQMRGSTNDPVEIARLDEKIDEMTIAVEDLDIEIEKGMAEMENLGRK